MSINLPSHCKRHPVLTIVLAWLIVMTPVGMTAEAAFHLDRADGSSPTTGLRFAPEVIGLRTARPATYEPQRASGTASGPSVRILEPREDFWRALADCESPDGRSGRFLGYFQFHPSTWRATGGGELGSYEHQKARAQQWASKVSPGTRAGWPHCWWVAKRKVGYAPA